MKELSGREAVVGVSGISITPRYSSYPLRFLCSQDCSIPAKVFVTECCCHALAKVILFPHICMTNFEELYLHTEDVLEEKK